MTTAHQEFLREHPVFRQLSGDYHALLAPHMREHAAATGDILLREGHPAEEFFILIDGAVDLYAGLGEGDEQWIQMIGPGEVIGWSWLVPPHRWAFGVRARVDSRLMRFDAPALRNLCERDPAFGYGTLKRISALMMERLHTVRSRMAGRIQGVEAG
jgi:CRP/FNR family cyclic AMP-dependent transcriptional regulator